MDRLISVIGEEAELFEEFLQLLEQQQHALINNDTENLKNTTGRLHNVAVRSQQMEKDRADVVEEIRLLNGAEDDLNVSKICDIADSQRSVQLRNLRETILNLYSSIEETRMRNGLLVEQSLEQIRNTIEIMGRIPARKDTYKKQGGVSREYVPLGVDRRV